jgi:hypothetical protein
MKKTLRVLVWCRTPSAGRSPTAAISGVTVSLRGDQISSTPTNSSDQHSLRTFHRNLLLATIGLKLSWGDYSTWVYGILCGVGGGLLHRFFAAECFGNTVAK